MPTTVLFIHGAWLTPTSWDGFRRRFEARGYRTMAPPWPHNDRPIDELRRSPDPALAKTTIGKLVDHYQREVRALSEPPVLVGHSFGGIIVQKLMDRGLGAAIVAIDPVPPRFVQPRPITLLSAVPVLSSWRGWNRVLTMSFKEFARNFAADLPETEQREAYQRYIVPTPGRLIFQTAAHIGDGVRWKNGDRAPLLLIAGEKDRTIEASMVRAAYKAYRRSAAITDFKLFPRRSHFLINSPGWEEVADYAIDWLGRYAPATSAVPVAPDNGRGAPVTVV
jgi:pimeloyl-ACP methyl ester carboxylesterase